MKPETPVHHQPITLHMETGQIGEIGEAWYRFVRELLRASDTIDQRRTARQIRTAETQHETTQNA